MENIKGFFKQSSVNQKLFKWTGSDYRVMKGNYAGKTIMSMYEDDPEFTMEFLNSILESEECSYHTRFIIEDIKKILEEK